MAWCRQATSHYLSQCWPRSLSPYDVTRPQWVNSPPTPPPPPPPGQNGRHFADDIFTCIFVSERFCVLTKFSLYIFIYPDVTMPIVYQSKVLQAHLTLHLSCFEWILVIQNILTEWFREWWIKPASFCNEAVNIEIRCFKSALMKSRHMARLLLVNIHCNVFENFVWKMHVCSFSIFNVLTYWGRVTPQSVNVLTTPVLPLPLKLITFRLLGAKLFSHYQCWFIIWTFGNFTEICVQHKELLFQ